MEYIIHFQHKNLYHDYHTFNHTNSNLFKKGDILLWGKNGVVAEWTITDILFDVDKLRWQIETIEGRWKT